MLEKIELKNIAKEKGYSIKNIETDYLLEVLLFAIYKEIGRQIVFKGGTALYKFYNLNRFSQDLDFTLDSSNININKFFNKIIKRLKDIDIKGRIKEINEYKNQKNIKLELMGPLFDGNPRNLSIVPINISLKEKIIYKPEQRMLFPKYRDIVSFDVFAMPLKELFAEKIRAMVTRDKARDVYDVWFLLKRNVDINIKDINKKLRLYKQTFNIKKLEEKIEEKRKNWKSDLLGLIIGNLPDFDKIKREIVEMVKQNKNLYPQT